MIDPATSKELGTVPEMTLEDVKTAIDAAGTAFKTWSKTTAKVGIDANALPGSPPLKLRFVSECPKATTRYHEEVI